MFGQVCELLDFGLAIACAGCLMAAAGVALAQQDSNAFVKWAAARAVPLRTVEPNGDLSDLAPLKSLVGAARVVALGEPNHGMHEPLALRNRLVRFLVEQMGFTAVALETGFTESYALERFVAGDPGELRSTVRNHMSWGFGNFPENEELLQWIREYNADTNHLTKVRFYGIDLTGAQDGAFPQARRAVDFAIAFLERADSEAAQRIREKLEPHLKTFSTGSYSSLLPTGREQLASGLTEISVAVSRQRDRLVSLSSQEEFEWALHSVEVARQLKSMFDVSPSAVWTGPGIPPDFYRASAARDSGMADNVRWALARENPKGRLIVFAHNNHVMNSTVIGGIWSAYRQPPSAMGRFLRPVLGRELVIIGGTSGASPDGKVLKADSTNLDSALAAVGIANFIIDLRDGRKERADCTWLAETRSLHANIHSFVSVTPGDAFDALYFVEKLSATRGTKTLGN